MKIAQSFPFPLATPKRSRLANKVIYKRLDVENESRRSRSQRLSILRFLDNFLSMPNMQSQFTTILFLCGVLSSQVFVHCRPSEDQLFLNGKSTKIQSDYSIFLCFSMLPYKYLLFMFLNFIHAKLVFIRKRVQICVPSFCINQNVTIRC